MICSCTGAFADNYSAFGKTAQAWAKSVNASGGIDGHPVELTVKDDASDAGKSVTAAHSLVSEQVDVIISGTILVPAWADVTSTAHIPVVAGNLLGPPFDTNPDFYPSGGTLSYSSFAAVSAGQQAGAKRLGVLYCAEAPSCQASFAQAKKAAAERGVALAYSGSVSLTAPNYTAQCLAAQRAGVQALLILLNATGYARAAHDCHQQGYDPAYIELGPGFKMSLASLPGLKNHLWAEFAVLPLFADRPVVHELNAVLDKYYPGLRKSRDFSQTSIGAWTGGKLIEAAVKASGASKSTEFSAQLITTGLNSIKGETLGGWSPPLTFTKGKPHATDCWFIGRVQNGKPMLVNGGKLTCKNGG